MDSGNIISTGRGGAGNMRASQKDDKNDSNAELPQLQGKRFTTGRGGKGNMMENIDPQSTRAAQDEGNETDFERQDLAPSTSMTVGRGGYGNNMRAVKSNGKYSQDGSSYMPGTSLCDKISGMFR